MILKFDIDFVFLSFDDPNVDKNFADLKRKSWQNVYME